MTKTISLLTNLLLCSTLFWAVPTVGGEELASGTEGIANPPADTTSYCHMKFPPMREETLSWSRPLLNEDAGNSIDFYGPCDHDPTGPDEVRAQRSVILQGVFGDSD
jgi:hypothetical protein